MSIKGRQLRSLFKWLLGGGLRTAALVAIVYMDAYTRLSSRRQVFPRRAITTKEEETHDFFN